MKHFLIQLCIIPLIWGISSVSFNDVAHARQDTTIDAAQEMLAWNQQYMLAYTELVSVFSTETMTSLYETDFNDISAMKRAYSRFNSQREAIINKATLMFSELPSPKRWDIQKGLIAPREKALFVAAKQQYEAIPETIQNIRDGSDFLPMINLIIEGKTDEAIQGFVDKQFTAGIALIESENKQVDSFLLAIPKDNPNYQFQKIVKLGNNFAIAKLELDKIELLEGASSSTRISHAEKMEMTIANIPTLITTGRKNLKSTRKEFSQLAQSGNGTPQERAFLQKVLKAMETFEQTFALETALYSNFHETLDLLRSDVSEDEFNAQSDIIDLKFFEIIDQRLQTMNERIALMQQ